MRMNHKTRAVTFALCPKDYCTLIRRRSGLGWRELWMMKGEPYFCP